MLGRRTANQLKGPYRKHTHHDSAVQLLPIPKREGCFMHVPVRCTLTGISSVAVRVSSSGALSHGSSIHIMVDGEFWTARFHGACACGKLTQHLTYSASLVSFRRFVRIFFAIINGRK
jgi:hypothetical protein